MRLEHFALQVPDPVAMADWYAKHLGFNIARTGGAPGHARFILDGPGKSMIEIYRNPAVSVPDYPSMSPLHLHLALVSSRIKEDRDRLVSAGASIAEDYSRAPTGDEFVMLRDPWGIALQLVKRAEPMVGE